MVVKLIFIATEIGIDIHNFDIIALNLSHCSFDQRGLAPTARSHEYGVDAMRKVGCQALLLALSTNEVIVANRLTKNERLLQFFL